ncbi:hypothetical protein HanPSC8_Chr10g0416911 [Helianthus annuus]|nr:hypothetical protein HanPSC8_Chr10g0416911 [Helianthus annuus]
MILYDFYKISSEVKKMLPVSLLSKQFSRLRTLFLGIYGTSSNDVPMILYDFYKISSEVKKMLPVSLLSKQFSRLRTLF